MYLKGYGKLECALDGDLPISETGWSIWKLVYREGGLFETTGN